MPQLIRNRGGHALIAGLAVALLAALSLPVLSGTAQAAEPSKNTKYTDSSVDSDISGKIKIKIGNNTNKIAKLTLVAQCEDGKDKIVQRNVSINPAKGFDIAVGTGQSIRGEFKSKHKVTGNFRTDLCGFFSGEYTAKD